MGKPADQGGDVQKDLLVSGAAALVAGIVKVSSDLTESLVSWLTALPGGGISGDPRIRRVVLAALSTNQGRGMP